LAILITKSHKIKSLIKYNFLKINGRTLKSIAPIIKIYPELFV
jgi:hypothetical protein